MQKFKSIGFLLFFLFSVYIGYSMSLNLSLKKELEIRTIQYKATNDQLNELRALKEVYDKQTIEYISKLVSENSKLINEISSTDDIVKKQQEEIVRLQRDSWKEFEATAYTPFCAGCSGVTSTGIDVRKNTRTHNIIAVDPKIIPLGSLVEIKDIGIFKAADTGGAIKGFKVDILRSTKTEAYAFGRQKIQIRILENKN